MANPLEILAQLQASKDAADALLATTDPAWMLRAAGARVLEFLLITALDAGPPPQFAAELGVNDEQAKVLYARVLRAAIMRQREAVPTNGRRG